MGISIFRGGDGTTPISGGQTLTECETVVYRGTVSKPAGTQFCAFEGGRIFIETPDAVVHDATPAGGVPCLGGTDGVICTMGVDSVNSQTIAYQVTGTGAQSATVRYGTQPCVSNPGDCGTAHDSANDTDDVVSGSNGNSRTAVACSNGQFCDGLETCDPQATDGVRQGLCENGTPPTCSDGNACTNDVCDPSASGGAGACTNPAVNCNDGNECTQDTCDPSTGCFNRFVRKRCRRCT